jgi:ankyrin repeat protein
LRDDAEAGEKKWREASENAERLAREASATSRDAETREKTLESEMARLATEAGARRGELEAERARVEALEEKVRLLGEARASEEASLTARASAREADAAEKLESMRSALALAEAKMVRMARDLAEAEEELEQRDAAEASRLEGLTMGLTMATSRMRVAAPETATADRNDAETPAETHVSSALEIQRERASVPRSEHDIFSKVRNNRHGEVETLLSSGAVSPDFRDRNGNTVLMVAAQNNRKRLVKACVRHGVPLDARNLKGNTAMHFAKAYGYEDVAEYLVRKGADPTIVNHEGLRPDQGLTAATTKVGGDVATTHDDERTNA